MIIEISFSDQKKKAKAKKKTPDLFDDEDFDLFSSTPLKVPARPAVVEYRNWHKVWKHPILYRKPITFPFFQSSKKKEGKKKSSSKPKKDTDFDDPLFG